MSKKYVIEIKSEYEDTIRGIMVLGAKDSNLFVDTLAVEDLEELNSDYINEHYSSLQDDAYERGHGIGYQKGFEDGKAVNDKGCEGCKYEWVEKDEDPCAHCSQCCNAYKNLWTAKDDKIEVGDEVRLCRHKVPYIVTSCDGDDDTYILMTVNGGFIKAEKYNVRKTNRHFDIKGILEAMKHD